MPNGFWQRAQPSGSSAFTTWIREASGARLRRGSRVITFSGHVAAHSPHCTHASSRKRSSGESGFAVKALVGQTMVQARHSVQPSVATRARPKGAFSGMAITGAAAPVAPRVAACSARKAWRVTSRGAPMGRNVSGCQVVRSARVGASASSIAKGSSVSMEAARSPASAKPSSAAER